MLFLRQELLLPKLSHKSHVNWYLEQFYWKIHVNICAFQSNKSILKKIPEQLQEYETEGNRVGGIQDSYNSK